MLMKTFVLRVTERYSRAIVRNIVAIVAAKYFKYYRKTSRILKHSKCVSKTLFASQSHENSAKQRFDLQNKKRLLKR